MNGIIRTVASFMSVCITPFLVMHEISRLAIMAGCVPSSLVAFLTMQIIR